MTDTEFSSDTTSTLSRAIEYDIRRNHGERVQGRRRLQPVGRAAKNNRQDGYVGQSVKAMHQRPNGSVKGTGSRVEIAVAVEKSAAGSVDTPRVSSTPSPAVDQQIAVHPQKLMVQKQLSQYSGSSSLIANPPLLEKGTTNKEDPTIGSRYADSDTMPMPPQVSKVIKHSAPPKPRTPPPLPPPRVESAKTQVEPERALSV